MVAEDGRRARRRAPGIAPQGRPMPTQIAAGSAEAERLSKSSRGRRGCRAKELAYSLRAGGLRITFISNWAMALKRSATNLAIVEPLA